MPTHALLCPSHLLVSCLCPAHAYGRAVALMASWFSLHGFGFGPKKGAEVSWRVSLTVTSFSDIPAKGKVMVRPLCTLAQISFHLSLFCFSRHGGVSVRKLEYALGLLT